MSVRSTVSVTLGNLRYESQVTWARASLTLLPGVNSVEVALPAAVPLDAGPGDSAEVVLDGGDGPETIVTGAVWAVRRTIDGRRVVVTDAGAALAAFRPNVTYERQTARDVVRALAADAGVSVGRIDLDLPLAAYAAAQDRTAADHVAGLCGLAGAIASVDGNGELVVVPRPSGSADVALLYGRELIVYETRDTLPSTAVPFVMGYGPAGTAEAPDALRHSPEPLPADAPEAGPDARRHLSALLRTPATADAASEAAARAGGASTSRIAAACFCVPALRPGLVVEVQELPDGVPVGPWLLTHVTHRVVPGAGGRTELSGVLGGEAGAGLLGALAGAIGGLL